MRGFLQNEGNFVARVSYEEFTPRFQQRSSNSVVQGSNKTIQRNIGHIGLLFVGEKGEADGFCGGILRVVD